MEKQIEKKLFSQSVAIELNTEEDDISIEQLEKNLTNFEINFTEQQLKACITETARELIDSIYEQSEDEPQEDELSKLVEDMSLSRMTVYSDAFMLFFTAENTFPGEEIVVQLNDQYEIEDMIVEEE